MLVKRLQAGDPEALEELVARFKPRLENQICARMGAHVRSKLDVEDVFQETFACVSESIARLKWQGEESFYRWVSSIAEHLIRNASRKKEWRLLELDREVVADDPSPSMKHRMNDRFDRLERALKSLGPEQRKALLMARIDGLKVKEIARRMGKTPDAVKKLLARALLQMKESFGDTESFHLPHRTFEIEREKDDDG